MEYLGWVSDAAGVFIFSPCRGLTTCSLPASYSSGWTHSFPQSRKQGQICLRTRKIRCVCVWHFCMCLHACVCVSLCSPSLCALWTWFSMFLSAIHLSMYLFRQLNCAIPVRAVHHWLFSLLKRMRCLLEWLLCPSPVP